MTKDNLVEIVVYTFRACEFMLSALIWCIQFVYYGLYDLRKDMQLTRMVLSGEKSCGHGAALAQGKYAFAVARRRSDEFFKKEYERILREWPDWAIEDKMPKDDYKKYIHTTSKEERKEEKREKKEETREDYW